MVARLLFSTLERARREIICPRQLFAYCQSQSVKIFFHSDFAKKLRSFAAGSALDFLRRVYGCTCFRGRRRSWGYKERTRSLPQSTGARRAPRLFQSTQGKGRRRRTCARGRSIASAGHGGRQEFENPKSRTIERTYDDLDNQKPRRIARPATVRGSRCPGSSAGCGPSDIERRRGNHDRMSVAARRCQIGNSGTHLQHLFLHPNNKDQGEVCGKSGSDHRLYRRDGTSQRRSGFCNPAMIWSDRSVCLRLPA